MSHFGWIKNVYDSYIYHYSILKRIMIKDIHFGIKTNYNYSLYTLVEIEKVKGN
jgi:hypothetical protein